MLLLQPTLKKLKIRQTSILSIIVTIVITTACTADSSTALGTTIIDPATPGSQSYELGQTVYNMQCATCHGANGEGQFPDAPLEKDLTGRYGAPPHDETGHTWHHDDDLLVQIIKEGGMGDPVNFYVMPALDSVLSDAEVEAVIAYIKTMWTPEQVATQQERTRLVREQNSPG